MSLKSLLYLISFGLLAQARKTDVNVGIDFGASQIKYGVYNDEFKFVDSISPYVQVNADSSFMVDVQDDELNFRSKPFKIKHLLMFDQSKNNHKLLPFPVVNINGTNAFQIRKNNNLEWIKCETILTRILNLIKSLVEEKLPVVARSVVIAISEYYDDKINDILFRALDKSMFFEVNLIRTPQAFSLGYRLLNEAYFKNLVLFDIGASKLEVTAVRITHEQIKMPNTFFNNSIGGDHFDYKVAEHLSKVFKKKSSHDILDDPAAKSRLMFEINKAKYRLEDELDVPIEVKSLLHDVDFKSSLGFDSFERLNQGMFQECENMLDLAFKKASQDVSYSPAVLAIGGSTKITKVKSLLERFTNKKNIQLEIVSDPIEIVYGASIYAAKKLRDKPVDKLPHVVNPANFSLIISVTIGLLTLIILLRQLLIQIQAPKTPMEEIQERRQRAAEAFIALVESIRLLNGTEQNIEQQHLADRARENQLQTLQIRIIENHEYLGQICIFCQEEFRNGDPIVVLPCAHVFHSENNNLENGCVGIQAWLRDHHNFCPVDRQTAFRNQL